MLRALVLYEAEPDPERYVQHVSEFVEGKVPGATFRHGKIFGSPFGERKFAYYAEFEWPDRDSFEAGTRSDEFAAAGKDAMEMGIPFQVLFADVT